MRRIALLFVLTSLFAASVNATTDTLEKELASYIEIFESNNSYQQIATAKKLEWSGFSEPRLFDPIEKTLLNNYTSSHDKESIDHMSWLCKALAYSGNKKYLATLELVKANGSHRKLKKYAQKSIAVLHNYSRLNPYILQTNQWNPNWSNTLNRTQSMLQSPELQLKRLAAKLIYSRGLYDKVILEQLQQQLLDNYLLKPNDKLFVDTWAWAAKALAASGQTQYHNTIERVATSAESKKLRKYAKRYQKDYLVDQ